MKRCSPSFDAVVHKVRDSRRKYINAGKDKGQNEEVYDRTLDVMYLFIIFYFIFERMIKAGRWLS
jgi:hypothetical protein